MCFGSAGAHRPQLERCTQQHAGFRGVDEIKRGLGRLASFRCQIRDLAGDESAGARGTGQFSDEIGRGVTAERLCRGENGEGLGQQGITGEDCYPLPEHFVRSGFAATEVVVVHARKVIVDERIGMDHFHRARRRKGSTGGATAGFGCGAAKQGT